MRLKVLTVPTALGLLLCIACNNSARQKPAPIVNAASADSTMAATDKEFYKVPSPPGSTKQRIDPALPAPAVNADWDKKIIRTADLEITAKNFGAFTNRLHQVVKQAGAYITQEQQTQSFSRIENTVTIKVPVDRFDDLLPAMATDSDRLMGKKINSEDVTGELVDTKARLETKKEVRQQYIDLLKQAKSMKDILAVQTEINSLQEDMDAAAGRVAYLGH